MSDDNSAAKYLFKITEAGRELLLGDSQIELTFSHIAIGDSGYSPEESITALRSERSRREVRSGRYDGTQLELSTRFTNFDDAAAYPIKEIGVFAQVPNEDDPVLVFIWSDQEEVFGYMDTNGEFVMSLAIRIENIDEENITINYPSTNEELLLASHFETFVQKASIVTPDALSDSNRRDDTKVPSMGITDDIYKLLCPIGTILAWHKHVKGESSPLSVPDGWVECNGQEVTFADGTLITLPDLNNKHAGHNSKGAFLRGHILSGEWEEDTLQRHKHSEGINGHKHGLPLRGGGTDISVASPYYQPKRNDNKGVRYDSHNTRVTVESPTNSQGRTSLETRPVNMSVVWIMRIR